MKATHATIIVSREYQYPVGSIFAHWTSTAARQRWEVGPDTGMAYDEFDTREGGVEIVRIHKNGKETGHMVQSHLRFVQNELISTSIVGVFGGAVSSAMMVTIEFSSTDAGCEIEALAQVTDLGGGDVRAQHEAGWDWILNRFEDDIAEHGIVTP